MKQLIILIFLGCGVHLAQAQSYTHLYSHYTDYKEASITHKRFSHQDIEPLVLQRSNDPNYEVSTLGTSIEGRPIYLAKWGNGDIPVLLWSQMHGDEPTATMAIMDIFNFLEAQDEMDPLREMLDKELTLYFIPMLNPDGAERFQRRNYIDIDLNRDAMRLQCPESQILKAARDSLQPMFGFNLHDQSIYYAAGIQPYQATISFLAPPYDYEKSENAVRTRAMQIIVELNNMLQNYIPNRVAKYSDDYEPRAFGDNIQKWGTSTILVESGGYPGDEEKQYMRQLNFVLLLSAFESIATEAYAKEAVQDYFKIPENARRYYDLIIRNTTLPTHDQAFKIDIGINNSAKGANIMDVGHLTTYFGYEEMDAGGLTIVPGKLYPHRLNKTSYQRHAMQYLRKGYLYFDIKKKDASTQLPFQVGTKEMYTDEPWRIGKNPLFFLAEKDTNGQQILRFAVLNSYILDLQTGLPWTNKK